MSGNLASVPVVLSVAAAFAAFVSPTIASAQNGLLTPRNECASKPGVAELDAGLRAATRTRETAALLALVSDDIMLDFGGGSGKAELTQRLASPDYLLWDELDRLLKLGCGVNVSSQGGASATWPWYFYKSFGQRDPYETQIVTGSSVRLRSAPSLSSRIIGSVSWDFVFMTEYPERGDPFAKVRTRSGRVGYMSTDYLRSEVDYRLVASNSSGAWKIEAFIAGD